MNLVALSMWTTVVESALYHFAYNYGQVFKDLSGDGEHGVNGNLVVADASDTFPTDRGAYFSSTSHVKLPPNAKVTTSTSFQSPFSFFAWVMSENDRGTIFLRKKDNFNYFFIMRGYWLNTLSIRLCRSDMDSGDIDGITNGFPYEVWKLISVIYSGDSIIGYVDTTLNIQYTIPLNTFGTGTFEYFIGKDSPIYSGFLGFIYYARTKNGVVNPNNLVGSSSSVCFETGCNSCTTSIVDPVLSLTACASTRIDQDRNSKGNICPSRCQSDDVGCSNDRECLLCGCDFKSCVYNSGISYCICPNIATPTQTTCICPTRYYHLEGECLNCMSSCNTCTTGSACTSCLATNAVLSSIGICSCPAGYYTTNEYMNTTDACMPCNSECSTCSEANLCLTCKSLNSSPNPLGGCICDDGYYGSTLITVNSCYSCYTGCQTCIEANKCTTCIKINAIPSFTIGCVCDTGYYLPDPSSNCTLCHSDCYSCVGPDTCLSCLDSNAIPDTIGCKCLNGYTINPSNNLCSICSSDCTSCDSNFTCLGCVNTNASPNDQYSCDCNERYFRDSVSCKSCHYSCKTCSNNSTCITCLDLNAEISTVGCKCKSGYFENNLQVCVKCGVKCFSCSDSLTCLTCVDGNAEVVSGDCMCKSKFFEDSQGLCVGCMAECSDCENNSTCSNCTDINAEVVSGLCQCKSGFFDNGSLCEACSHDCKNCLNSTFCLTCAFENALPNSNGLCNCKEFYYNTSSTCDSCHIDCATCSEPLKCITCLDPNSEVSSISGCTCKQFFYLSSGLCQSCLSSCQTCSNNETCLTCKDPNAEVLQGLCHCKVGYYQSLSSCDLCQADCATCNAAFKCLTCLDVNSIPDAVEGCVCKPGYYFDNIICTNCGIRCNNCTSSSLCIECSDAYSEIISGVCVCVKGYYSGSDNVCHTCHEDCEICSGMDLCDTCKDINAEVDSSAGCKCKLGFYNAGNSCVSCPSDCASCESSSLCLSCKDANGDLGKLCECIDGMYFDSMRVCQNCHFSCATCDSYPSCTFCKDPNSLLQSGVCSCKSQFYNNSNQCSSCDSTCLTCDNPTTCLTCLYSNAILTSSNTCTCPTSYTLQDYSCIPCDSSCLTCSSPSACLTCLDANAEVQFSGICFCKSRFYLSGTCLPCNNLCETCLNAISCTTCIDSNMIIGSSGLCECKNGYFFNDTLLICQQCKTGCNKCNDALICIECTDTHSYGENCLPCSNKCLTCDGDTLFDCLSCEGGYILNGFCIEKCPLKFSDSNGTCEFDSDTGRIIEYTFEGDSEEFYDLINKFIAFPCTVVNSSNETRRLTDGGIVPIYQRGAYFYGNEMLEVNISGIYLLPSDFSVSLWIKAKTSNAFLMSKIFNNTDVISISINSLKVMVSIQINYQVYTFQSSSNIDLEEWTHLLLSVSYTENTLIELFIDTERNINEIIYEYPFMDLNTEFLYIGGTAVEELYFQGYLYSLEIYAQATAVNSLVSECSECNLCPYGGSCIPECDIGEFYDTSISKCASCPDECPQNCRYSTTCQLCEDSYCMSCFSYELNSCLSCEPGYQVIDYVCEKCLENQYHDSDSGKCFDCQELCTTCTSSTCKTCIDNSEIVEGTCKCLRGYEYKIGCQRVYFSAELEITDKNNIIIVFRENLLHSLKDNYIEVKIDDKDCDYELTEYTKTKYSLSIDETKISKKSVIKIFFIVEILSEDYFLLETKELQGDLYYSSEVKEAQELIKEAKASKAAAKTGSTAGASTAAGLGLLTMDPTSFFDFLNTAEMFYSIYFFNLDIHPILSEYLLGMRMQDLIPNIYGYLISADSGTKMSKKLKKFGYDSNLIILNVGVQLTTLTVAVIIVLLLLPLYCIKKIRNKLGKITKIFKFGFFLRFWLQTSFEIMIACTFGIIYSDFNGGIQRFDFILSFIILFIQACFLILFLYLIKKRSKLSDEEEIKEFIKKFGTFFEEFKMGGVHNWLFYVIYVFRRIILVVLYHSMSYGILQLAICMTMSLCVPVYIGITRSFKSNVFNYYHFANELTISAYFCVIFFSSFENLGIDSKRSANICINLITTAWAMNIACSLFNTVTDLYGKIRSCIKRCRKKNVAKNYRIGTSPELQIKDEKTLEDACYASEPSLILNAKNSKLTQEPTYALSNIPK